MTVYQNDQPRYLQAAIQSVLNQTHTTNDFQIIVDGPIGSELQSVLDQYADAIKITSLATNQGLGGALKVGVELVKNEFVARMDADDISVPQRMALQTEFLHANPNIVAVSSDLLEMDEDGTLSNRVKHMPQVMTDIKKTMVYRNPINHPAVMFRKSAVLEVGNYINLYKQEDYYLWIRLVQHGFELANISQPLVYMRMGDSAYQRRGDMRIYKSAKVVSKYMLEHNMISIYTYWRRNMLKWVTLKTPNQLRKIIYQRILRKEV
ncbi:MAG: glycosyltransferase [Streptococcaceae bacterium]|jgi:glycosyltransferase involved in cell wall biosynthesis|nr:glycosyltransferase [Streptococcaceae bacterium]